MGLGLLGHLPKQLNMSILLTVGCVFAHLIVHKPNFAGSSS